MLYTKCPACGVPLRRATGGTSVCPKCFRGFRSSDPPLSVPAVQQPAAGVQPAAAAKRGLVAALFGAIIIFSMCGELCVLPFVMAMIVVFIRFYVKEIVSDEPEDSGQESMKNPATSADYLTQFRKLKLDTMPLGQYGEEAVQQIRQLDTKRQALRELLGQNHPFAKNSEETAKFVLANCKQILFRLRYCDQNDPAFCRIHAEYMQTRLQENAKVLRDFEQLIIEVTQMNDDLPAEAPCLDVLADTLRNVRTQDGALQQQRMMQ